jgi:hypothetical protein
MASLWTHKVIVIIFNKNFSGTTWIPIKQKINFIIRPLIKIKTMSALLLIPLIKPQYKPVLIQKNKEDISKPMRSAMHNIKKRRWENIIWRKIWSSFKTKIKSWTCLREDLMQQINTSHSIKKENRWLIKILRVPYNSQTDNKLEVFHLHQSLRHKMNMIFTIRLRIKIFLVLTATLISLILVKLKF